MRPCRGPGQALLQGTTKHQADQVCRLLTRNVQTKLITLSLHLLVPSDYATDLQLPKLKSAVASMTPIGLCV